MYEKQGRKIEGTANELCSSGGSREMNMERWVKGPEFSAEGLSISVLCARGSEPLMAVSAKAGRFYYAEKVEGLSADILDPEHMWFMSFLDRAKRKKRQQDAFLGCLRNGLSRLAPAQ